MIKEYLDCPCCGDTAASSDDNGMFYDGQELNCGCVGAVLIDDAGEEPEAFVSIGECDCEASK